MKKAIYRNDAEFLKIKCFFFHPMSCYVMSCDVMWCRIGVVGSNSSLSWKLFIHGYVCILHFLTPVRNTYYLIVTGTRSCRDCLVITAKIMYSLLKKLCHQIIKPWYKMAKIRIKRFNKIAKQNSCTMQHPYLQPTPEFILFITGSLLVCSCVKVLDQQFQPLQNTLK